MSLGPDAGASKPSVSSISRLMAVAIATRADCTPGCRVSVELISMSRTEPRERPQRASACRAVPTTLTARHCNPGNARQPGQRFEEHLVLGFIELHFAFPFGYALIHPSQLCLIFKR